MVEVDNVFGEDGHLSEEALALYVDAVRLHKVYLLPEAVLGHVDDCQHCKSEIVEALSLVEEQRYNTVEPHPYFSKNAHSTPARYSLGYRIAAAFLVGISIGMLFYLFRFINENRRAS